MKWGDKKEVKMTGSILWPFIIFFSRILDVSLGTIRVRMIVQRNRFLAALIGFFEVFIFILIVSKVIQNIGNIINVVAYALGFATGNLVGITISERMSRPILNVNILSREKWKEIEEALRNAGFGVTRLPAFGKEGMASLLNVVISAKSLPRLREIVYSIDPKAFMFAQPVESLRGGYVYGIKSKI